MEFNLDNTEQWFLERAKRTTPKRLKKVQPLVRPLVRQNGNAYRNTRSGLREDLGIVTRSGWEADTLRILKSYNIKFEYEPFAYVFPIKRGNKSYLPDVYLPLTDELLEIKGFFSEDSRIKIKRFKMYYPLEFERFNIIINKGSKESLNICRQLEIPNILFWQDIRQLFRDKISNWESR